VRIRPHNHKPRDVAVFNNTIVAAGLGVGLVGGDPGFTRLLEHNLVFGDPAIESEVPGDNFADSFQRATSAFVRLSLDPEQIDLTLREPLPTPSSTIDARWLGLTGAGSRRRAGAAASTIYGACGAESAPRPCR
jgi:hypothetical protein